jgi:hypothetical protein
MDELHCVREENARIKALGEDLDREAWRWRERNFYAPISLT